MFVINLQIYHKDKSQQHKQPTWYLRLFWETTCRALTCTAFTAFLEESTKPFVIVPIKPGCTVVEVPSELSSDEGAFGDKRNPNPLVKREKVDFPAFPVGESSCVVAAGWEIFKLLAHEDIAEGDNLDDTSRGELSGPESAAAGVCMAAGGCTPGALRCGEVDESADSESIPQPRILTEIEDRSSRSQYKR